MMIVFFGCSSQPRSPAPIVDASPIPTHKLDSYMVRRGDTLYGIAWKFNLDFRELANLNELGADYRIHPGQILALSGSKTAIQTSSAIATKPVSSSIETTKKLKKQSPDNGEVKNRTASDSAIRWQWPARGRVVAGFASSDGLNKGIDIGGKFGEPVFAAADGTVVYSGSGLRGYGKLLIVKHSDKLLSAYAHNSELLVSEGDFVQVGKTIAKIGSSGPGEPRLHFEIRFDGRPVDPIRYLPKR